MKVIH